MHDRRILVIGLGDLGGTLAAGLAAAGARVIGVRRGASAPDGVQLEAMDARDPDLLARLPDVLDAAVLCVTPSSFDEAGYRDSYVAIARAFAARWDPGRVGRVLWVSSTAVYGQGAGAELDDASETLPASFRGRVMLEAESALRASGAGVTAVRLSGIYGPGRSALIRRVLQGRGAPAVPAHYTNRIHRDDAVGVLTWLLDREFAGESLPDAVLATDPHPSPRHEVLAWLARRLDVRLTPELGDDRAPSRRMLPKWLLAAGYRFCHPDYRSGFEAVLAAMEVSGELADLRAASAPDA